MFQNVSKKSGQLNISITPEQAAFLEKLARHRITAPELVRGLIDAAASFYEKNGWFSFPVTITPETFQNQEAAPSGKSQGAETSVKADASNFNNDGPISNALKTGARRLNFAKNAQSKSIRGETLSPAESDAVNSQQGIPARPLATRKKRKPRKQVGF